MDFKIYYEDRVFAGAPQDAPKHGVICILQQHDQARWHMVSNAPYYIYVGGEWLGAWENDIVDYLMHRPGKVEQLIMGRLVPKAVFNKIYKQAQDDRRQEA